MPSPSDSYSPQSRSVSVCRLERSEKVSIRSSVASWASSDSSDRGKLPAWRFVEVLRLGEASHFSILSLAGGRVDYGQQDAGP